MEKIERVVKTEKRGPKRERNLEFLSTIVVPSLRTEMRWKTTSFGGIDSPFLYFHEDTNVGFRAPLWFLWYFKRVWITEWVLEAIEREKTYQIAKKKNHFVHNIKISQKVKYCTANNYKPLTNITFTCNTVKYYATAPSVILFII